jgi:uncharacterized protein YkwD
MLIDEYSILEKACEKDFCYKDADISLVSKCQKGSTCVKHEKKLYLVKKKNNFTVNSDVSGKKIALEITPDNAYISYSLFVEHKAGVYMIKLKNRKIVIDKGVPEIISLQIVGSAVTGPTVLWQKTLGKTTKKEFKKDFDSSLKQLRLSYSLRPLSVDESLKKFAEKSFEKITNEGLVHYSNSSGSLRHSGIHRENIGENLFTAKSMKTAWEMMVSSPSHLYNFLNPGFGRYLLYFKKEDGAFSGAVIFSN